MCCRFCSCRVLFAFALTLIGERGRPVFALVEALTPIFYRIVGFIMWAAPLGAFGSIAFTVGKFGTSSLVQLGALILEFYVVSLLFVFVVLRRNRPVGRGQPVAAVAVHS